MMTDDNARQILRKHFDAEEGSFLLTVRDLRWNWEAFREMTAAMYHVAAQAKEDDRLERWIAEGFWSCDTWLRNWTGHSAFPRPPERAYTEAMDLIWDLAFFYFRGADPYTDDEILKKKATGPHEPPPPLTS